VARAIENGQTQVTREQVDAEFARADTADAKWKAALPGQYFLAHPRKNEQSEKR
jgi:hypothetical protein